MPNTKVVLKATPVERGKTTKRIDGAINEILTQKDLEKANGNYGKIHMHTLRHTYSNMLFELNENPKIIQALL